VLGLPQGRAGLNSAQEDKPHWFAAFAAYRSIVLDYTFDCCAKNMIPYASRYTKVAILRLMVMQHVAPPHSIKIGIPMGAPVVDRIVNEDVP